MIDEKGFKSLMKEEVRRLTLSTVQCSSVTDDLYRRLCRSLVWGTLTRWQSSSSIPHASRDDSTAKP